MKADIVGRRSSGAGPGRARDRGALARDVERARIVLLAADGVVGKEIAARVGCAEPTAVLWRRYAEAGLAGAAVGQAPTVPEAVRDRVLALTRTEPPVELGATYWPSRLLAARLAEDGHRLSQAPVARIWRRFGVQPWRAKTCKFSTAPELDAKIRDVVGLYLHPPEKAVVRCVDEKPQVQALERTAPVLPTRPGQPGKHTHDYRRHATTCAPRWRWPPVRSRRLPRAAPPSGVPRVPPRVATAYPRRPLPAVYDNYATHTAGRCGPGSSAIRESSCTAPRPWGPG